MAASVKTTTLFGGFEAITGLDFRKAIVDKGKEMTAHIFNVKEVRTYSETDEIVAISISGECIREMSLSNTPWRIVFELNPYREIVRARCNCTAGIDGMCKHTAALFNVVNSERTESCTDAEQVWSKPSQKLNQLYPKGESIQKLFFQRSPTKRDYSGQSFDQDRLVKLMEKHSLQNSSVYKTLTAKPVKEDKIESPSIDVDPLLKKLLQLPVQNPMKNQEPFKVRNI